MDVGVAIGTMRAYVLEDEVGVALCTCNLLMHAAQRVSGLVVIELWIRSNRLPTRVCMAVLARRRQWPVGIGYLGLRPAHRRPVAVRRLL
jgi:hypothetical protein